MSQLHPGSAPQLCGLPAGHRTRGHLHQVLRTRTERGAWRSPWVPPRTLSALAGPGATLGTHQSLLAVGSSGETEAGGHGAVWEPRGPRAGSALAAGAIYSRHCHVSDVCSSTGGLRGQPRLCLLRAVSRCPHHIKGPGGPCPCPSPHRGAQRAPWPSHLSPGSGAERVLASSCLWAERG